MIEVIVSFLVGVLCIAIGISNYKGNIESLHSYHRHRVSEEDRIPFGKKIGLGTILCGAGVVLFSVLMALSVWLESSFYALIGSGLMILFLGIGLVVVVKALLRYNKGIF